MQTHHAGIECRNFAMSDRVMDFHEHGHIDAVKLADGTAGFHAVFEPGWRWSMDEKPLLGNPDSCPMTHTGYCIAGELVILMVDTGEQRTIHPGDFFEIPAGHDGYVAGDVACELILFVPPERANEVPTRSAQ